jgi:hypothetical protein
MSEAVELLPLGENEDRVDEIGAQIYRLVDNSQTQELLDTRHFWGVLARHSRTMNRSIAEVRRAAEAHQAKKFGAYAIIGTRGDVLGMATSIPDLKLRRQISPLPPKFSRPLGKLLSTFSLELHRTAPNVAAWTGINHKEALANSYYRVAELSGYKGWTIEPVRSPDFIFRALQGANFLKLGTHYYDDYESRHNLVPKAILAEFLGKRIGAAAEGLPGQIEDEWPTFGD